MRVAQVVATAGATGVESHLLALLAAFDRGEVDPILFVPRGGPLVERSKARGIAVETGAPERKLDFSSVSRLARRWAGAIDVVHAHGARATFWAARAARAAGLPLVVTVHELRWRSWPAGPRRSLWLALERLALERAERLIAVSQAVRSELVARHPRWADRVVVVPGSSPLLLERGATRPMRDTSARPRLVAVGRLERVKGHDRLLEALARLDPSIMLDVAGAGPLAADLRMRADALGVAERVRWHGGTADIPALLSGADIFVSGSHEETLGLAVLEAMAAGLPVVVPAVGGLVELVGDAGIQVAPEPERDFSMRLAFVIDALTRDPGRAQNLARAACERAWADYDPAVLAARVAALYREIKPR
jgi:glycosyltransferase involved in cell wall biosynthesis